MWARKRLPDLPLPYRKPRGLTSAFNDTEELETEVLGHTTRAPHRANVTDHRRLEGIEPAI
jgi:hypothetical protein